MRIIRRVGLAALTAAALGTIGCSSAPAKKGPPATPVRVATATLVNAPIDILASGVVEPMQTVAVTAQVSGSLLSSAFKEGDFVQKGQVLFHIDPRPLDAAVDQARAALARDEAQAEAARRDDERYKKLADMGYVSRSQSDQAHATAVAQAATAQADRAALRSAEVNLGFATIRAPIAGRTGSLLVRPGNNVGPSTGPLVVINQLSPVLVRFPVLEQDFDGLQRAVAAHPLVVTANASDSTPTSERGQLSFLDNTVDSLTGTVTGKARFENVGRRMWPGELVFLTIELDVQRGVVGVPTDAVLTGQQGAYVYVVDNTGRATTRNVAPGVQVNDLTVVRSGLQAGERVVIDGQSRLNPGSKVAIINTNGDTSRAGGLETTSGTAAGELSNPNYTTAGRAGGSGSAAPEGQGRGTPGGSAADTRVAPTRGNAGSFVQSPSAQTTPQTRTIQTPATTPSVTRTPTGATTPATITPGSTTPAGGRGGTPTTRTAPTPPATGRPPGSPGAPTTGPGRP